MFSKEPIIKEIPETLSLKDIDVSDLPDEFDSRVKWPECSPPVKNSGECGSNIKSTAP